MPVSDFLRQCLHARLADPAREWLQRTSEEIHSGLSDTDYCVRLSMASRAIPRGPLNPTATERARARELDPDFDPERWSQLEAARVILVLSRPDLAEEQGARSIEEAFRYADEGELCALYKSLAHLPEPARFAWRAGEGCRTNMRSVFESVVCDTPFPSRYFDEVAWRQALIKCVFVEAPLWRIRGLDRRLDEELARMALDLADERRSAGRPIQPELWLCVGEHGGDRGLAALEQELDPNNTNRRGRVAATLALGRAGRRKRLQALAEDADPAVREAAAEALAGPIPQTAFARVAADGILDASSGATSSGAR